MRESKIKLKGQEEVSAKDNFRYSTVDVKPVAKPVDAYTGAGDAGASLGQAAQALASLNKLPEVFMSIQDVHKEKNKAQGLADGLTGNYNKPSGFLNIGVGYNEAFEESEGHRSAGSFHTEARELQKNAIASGISSEELAPQYEELVKKYADGKSTFFLKGFLPYATQAEEALEREHNDAIRVQLADKKLEGIHNKTFFDLQGLLKAGGIVSDIAALENDKALWEQFRQLGVSTLVKPQALRDNLTTQQKQAKGDGLLNTQQVSEKFTRTVGETAARLGMPELMDYAFIQDSGVAVVDANRELVENYISEATRVRDARLKALQSDNRAVNYEYLNSVANMVDAGDPTQAASFTRLLDQGRAAGWITDSNAESKFLQYREKVIHNHKVDNATQAVIGGIPYNLAAEAAGLPEGEVVEQLSKTVQYYMQTGQGAAAIALMKNNPGYKEPSFKATLDRVARASTYSDDFDAAIEQQYILLRDNGMVDTYLKSDEIAFIESYIRQKEASASNAEAFNTALKVRDDGNYREAVKLNYDTARQTHLIAEELFSKGSYRQGVAHITNFAKAFAERGFTSTEVVDKTEKYIKDNSLEINGHRVFTGLKGISGEEMEGNLAFHIEKNPEILKYMEDNDLEYDDLYLMPKSLNATDTTTSWAIFSTRGFTPYSIADIRKVNYDRSLDANWKDAVFRLSFRKRGPNYYGDKYEQTLVPQTKTGAVVPGK